MASPRAVGRLYHVALLPGTGRGGMHSPGRTPRPSRNPPNAARPGGRTMMKYLAVTCLLGLALPAHAQDKKKPDAPATIVLDVSKLPPDVVQKLLALAAEAKKPIPAEEGKN